jgi:hypothetical protein
VDAGRARTAGSARSHDAERGLTSVAVTAGGIEVHTSRPRGRPRTCALEDTLRGVLAFQLYVQIAEPMRTVRQSEAARDLRHIEQWGRRHAWRRPSRQASA